MSTPVCATCDDTHRMTLSRDGDADRVVMCTGCPVPCQRCHGGNGPFCATTPCGCACHVGCLECPAECRVCDEKGHCPDHCRGEST